jgi:hypothetical protein
LNFISVFGYRRKTLFVLSAHVVCFSSASFVVVVDAKNTNCKARLLKKKCWRIERKIARSVRIV